jgi:zinc protease
MPEWVVERHMDALNDQGQALRGAKVLLLGVADKKDIDDVRESPALVLFDVLGKKGATVEYHDPHIAHVREGRHYKVHQSSVPLTAERVAALDPAKMYGFYRDRFANAADFTVFMVGAFTVDAAVPLLAQYVGTLPSTGQRSSQFRDVALKFPEGSQKVTVEQGREPRGQTVISFFADPPADPAVQENVSAATTVLDIALRDILREDLGQTYTVSVNLSQSLPQRGAGHTQVRFGAAPENLGTMTARVLQEIRRLQAEGPSDDLTNRAKESARRDYETALKQNGYWLRRLDTVHLFDTDPADIARRIERIDGVTPKVLRETFAQYFPADRYTVATLAPQP